MLTGSVGFFYISRKTCLNSSTSMMIYMGNLSQALFLLYLALIQ